MRNSDVPTSIADLRLRVRRFLSVRKCRIVDGDDPISEMQSAGLEPHLFGGCIRDIAIDGPHAKPRDLDVVVQASDVDELQAVLAKWVVRKTRFGGLRLETKSEVLDVWPASETWAFKQFPLLGSDPGDLPKTTPFDIEGVVVSLSPTHRGRTVYERNFFSALSKRSIGINLTDHLSESLSIVRAFAVAIKLDFTLESSLVDHLSSMIKRTDIEEMSAIAFQHYGFTRFTNDELNTFCKAVARHQRSASRSALRLPRLEQLRIPYRFKSCSAGMDSECQQMSLVS